MIRYYSIFLFALFSFHKSNGQDPHFSQFFMAPQFINPATVGANFAKWNVQGNFRQQWGNAKTPFNTQVVSFDMNLSSLEKKDDLFSVGASLMSDQSMYGAFKSTYAIGTLSYQKNLSKDDYENQYLCFGASCLYGSRNINFSQLHFGEQFGSGGFDITRPTGETFLNTGKSFISLNSGLLLRDTKDNVDYRIGIAAYNINLPRQSFLSQRGEVLPMRTVVYADISSNTPNERVTLHGNFLFNKQAIQQYFSAGAAIGYNINIDKSDRVVYTGLFLREEDCIYPYLSVLYQNVQVGITYDITASKQNQGPYTPQSFELSFIYRSDYETEFTTIDQNRCPGTKRVIKPWAF